MAKRYKYTLVRRAIVWETWTVEADTLEEAEELCYNGDADLLPETEFIDYYDSDYELADQETLDPLVKMVEEYNGRPKKEKVV